MPDGLKLRQGGPDNIADVMRIMLSAFPPRYGEAWNEAQTHSMLTLPHNRLYLAELAGMVTGFCLTRAIVDEEEILLLAVDPAYRRHAIGSHLLRQVIDDARTQSRKFLFLEVRKDNPAILMYEKSGFLPIGERKSYYCGNDGTRYDAMTMGYQIYK